MLSYVSNRWLAAQFTSTGMSQAPVCWQWGFRVEEEASTAAHGPSGAGRASAQRQVILTHACGRR